MAEYSLDDLRMSQPVTVAGEASEATPGSAAAGSAGVPTAPVATDAQAAYGATKDASNSAASATGYNAQTGEIDPNTMTAAGQMTAITGQDSPLMRRAAQEGMLAAGRRGLENSSFAAGAAQGAMVDRATPLAQQDANTYYQNLRANVDAQNRAAEVSTGRTTDVSLANAQLSQQVELANADAYNRMAQLNAQLETAVNQQNADAANRIKQQMADIESQIAQRNAELETQTNLANADAITRTGMLNAELGTNVSLANAGAQNQMAAHTQTLNAELNRQWLAGSQAVDLENIRGRYQQLISSNQTAAQMYDSYLSGLSSIMQNRDITPDRVAQYVNVLGRQLEGGLEFIDAINGLDLGVVGDVPSTTSTGTGDNATISTPGAATPSAPDAGVAPGSYGLPPGVSLEDFYGGFTGF